MPHCSTCSTSAISSCPPITPRKKIGGDCNIACGNSKGSSTHTQPSTRTASPKCSKTPTHCHELGSSTQRAKKKTPKKRSEEHTSELQSRETISYAVFC